MVLIDVRLGSFNIENYQKLFTTHKFIYLTETIQTLLVTNIVDYYFTSEFRNMNFKKQVVCIKTIL